MDLSESQIVFLILESCGCIALIGIILYCLMKRKRKDVGPGSNNDETKRQKVETGGPSYAETDERQHHKQGNRKCDTVSILDDKILPSKPKGIPNVGASCFMNSMLQCVSWSPCLRKQLENQVEKMKPKQYKGKLATTLLSLLKLNHAEDENTTKLRGCRRRRKNQKKNVQMFCKELEKENHRFTGRSQEDSFEFYNTLISGLEDEALQNFPFRPKEEGVTEMEHIMQTCDVTRLFGGMFMTCYCYKECGHVEPVFQRFTSLSLPPVVKKRIEDDKPKPTFAKKKRQRSSRHVDIDSASGSVDVSATREPSSGQPKRIVDETTRIVSNQDHQMKTRGGYGTIHPSQEMGENRNRKHNETSMTKSTTNPTESSDTLSKESIDMSSLRKHLPNVEEPEETGLKSSKNANKNGKVVSGNKDYTNDTDGSTTQSDIDKVSPDIDDQEPLSDGNLDDIKRLPSLRLGKRRNKSKRKRTGLELGLDKLTDFEKMMAADLPCRICTKKKGKCGGVLYKQIQLVSLPQVLVLHINRFEQKGSQLHKFTDFVSYPKILDMTEFCSKASEKLLHGQEYSLFGVVNHQGSMRGGHYYAYIKTNHRDVQHIQNQLQNSWKDPEAMASEIRTQLEATWKTEPEDKEDVDSQTSQTINDVQKKKTDGYREDGSLGHNNDQHYPADQNRRSKEKVTFDNQDNKQDIIYEGNKRDLQKDSDFQRCEKQIGARNSEDKESCARQVEDGTPVCQTGQNGSVLEEIRHNNNHDAVKDSDYQEDLHDPVRTKSPMSDVHGENKNAPNRPKRPAIDVQEEDMTSPDQKKKRKSAVQEEVKNDPDRKQEHQDTDLEEEMNNPVREKEHKKVAPEKAINDVQEEVKNDPDRKQDHQDTDLEEDMNNPVREKEHKKVAPEKVINDVQEEVKNDPDRKQDHQDTDLEENMNNPVREKEHKKAAPEKAINDVDLKTNETKDAVRKGDMNNPDLNKEIEDEIREEDIHEFGIKKENPNFLVKNRYPLGRSKEQKETVCQENINVSGRKKRIDKKEHFGFVNTGEKEEDDKDPDHSTNGKKRRDNNRRKEGGYDTWFYVSDSMVQKEEESTVFTSISAYILLYEQVQ